METLMLPIVKICKECLLEKPVTEFWKNIRYKDGYFSSCAVCETKKRQNRRLREPKIFLDNIRTCTNCNKSKNLNEFSPSQSCIGGRRWICRDCSNQNLRERRDNPEEKLKDKIRAFNYNHEYRGRFSHYKGNAKRKNLDFCLTQEQFKDWFDNTECFYCGEHISTVGLDRVDSNKGYTSNNIVFCCYPCNLMKMDLPFLEFKNRLRKIHKHLSLNRGN